MVPPLAPGPRDDSSSRRFCFTIDLDSGNSFIKESFRAEQWNLFTDWPFRAAHSQLAPPSSDDDSLRQWLNMCGTKPRVVGTLYSAQS